MVARAPYYHGKERVKQCTTISGIVRLKTVMTMVLVIRASLLDSSAIHHWSQYPFAEEDEYVCNHMVSNEPIWVEPQMTKIEVDCSDGNNNNPGAGLQWTSASISDLPMGSRYRR